MYSAGDLFIEGDPKRDEKCISRSEILRKEGISVADFITQITTFLTQALVWIGQILTFAVGQPLILFFMAVGLAGAMFRWARRLVHF